MLETGYNIAEEDRGTCICHKPCFVAIAKPSVLFPSCWGAIICWARALGPSFHKGQLIIFCLTSHSRDCDVITIVDKADHKPSCCTNETSGR